MMQIRCCLKVPPRVELLVNFRSLMTTKSKADPGLSCISGCVESEVQVEANDGPIG